MDVNHMRVTPSRNGRHPIGVFDSGVGGLTVLKTLMSAMPDEHFIYLGDTARVPYGTKSAETICTYSLGLARILLNHNVRMIVIACNTASAYATESVRIDVAPVPVVGMIGPAVAAAVKATKNKTILLMGTQSTVRSGCYATALKQADPDITVHSVPAQLLVALAEEGWTSGLIAHEAVNRYIGSFFNGSGDQPDTIILGCTHFPLLRDIVAEIAGPDVSLIDSGVASARFITGTNTEPDHLPSNRNVRFLVTDSAERFAVQAEKFLGWPIDSGMITHIDLGDIQTSIPVNEYKGKMNV